MKQTIYRFTMIGLLALPMLSMADSVPATCGGQNYQSLLQQCTTAVPTACQQIIQNNCLSIGGAANASVTLGQITQAMIQQYAAQATAKQPPSGLSTQAANQVTTNANDNSFEIAKQYQADQQRAVKAVKNSHKPAKQTNYWF